eukprot:3665613-Rhodomonas_salina.2
MALVGCHAHTHAQKHIDIHTQRNLRCTHTLPILLRRAKDDERASEQVGRKKNKAGSNTGGVWWELSGE